MVIDRELLKQLLEISARNHKHLCPRQVLGVRIGLKGLSILGMEASPVQKKLLVISETDGCFIDGIIAATQCTVGHRTLRIEDYGKIAATFANVSTGHTVRIAPQVNVRERAWSHVSNESRHYFVQLQAYQVMSDEELLTIQPVTLTPPLEAIISNAGVRVNCGQCGEEIINGREVLIDGKPYCTACSQKAYYRINPL